MLKFELTNGAPYLARERISCEYFGDNLLI